MTRKGLFIALLALAVYSCQNPFYRPEAQASLDLTIELPTPQSLLDFSGETRIITQDARFLVITLEAFEFAGLTRVVQPTLNPDGFLTAQVSFLALPGGKEYTITAQARDRIQSDPDSQVLYEGQTTARVEAETITIATLSMSPAAGYYSDGELERVEDFTLAPESIAFRLFEFPEAGSYRVTFPPNSPSDVRVFLQGANGQVLDEAGLTLSWDIPEAGQRLMIGYYNPSLFSSMIFRAFVAEESVTANFTGPEAPSFLTPVENDGGILTLSWSPPPDPDNEDDLAGYVLYESFSDNTVELDDPTLTTYDYTVVTTQNSFTLTPYDIYGNFGDDPATVSWTYSGDFDPPAAVTGFTAVIGSDAEAPTLTFSWNQSPEPDVAGYEITNVTDGISTTINGATTITSGALTGLGYTTYEFEIVAVDLSGNQSDPTTLGITILEPISDLVVDSTTEDSITLSWTEPVGATGDVVITVDGTNYTQSVGVGSYTVTGLPRFQSVTNYTVFVALIDGTSLSESLNVPASTLADLTATAKVSGVITSPADFEIGLSWTNPPETDFSHIVLEYKLATDTTWTSLGNIGAVDSYLLSGLGSTGLFDIYLIAVDEAGNTNTLILQEFASATAGSLENVSSVNHTSTETSITVTWIDPTDPAVAEIHVGEINGTTVIPLGVETHTFSVPASNPELDYNVSFTTYDAGATNSSGVLSYTATNTADTTPPAAPAAFTASPGDGLITLSWTDSADYDGFQILYGDADPPTLTYGGAIDPTGTDITGLTNGTLYYFSIVASDVAGNVSPESTASATPALTDTTPPPSPGDINPGNPGNTYIGVGSTTANGNVAISWDEPTDPDFAGTRIIITDVLTPANVDDVFFAAGVTQGFSTPGFMVNGLEYTIEIYFEDDSGNQSPPWSPGGNVLYLTNGDLELQLDFGPGDPTISITSGTTVLSIGGGDTLQLASSESYPVMNWYLNDITNIISTGMSNLSISAGSYSPGQYTLLFVGEDSMGVPVSATFEFEIVQ